MPCSCTLASGLAVTGRERRSCSARHPGSKSPIEPCAGNYSEPGVWIFLQNAVDIGAELLRGDGGVRKFSADGEAKASGRASFLLDHALQKAFGDFVLSEGPNTASPRWRGSPFFQAKDELPFQSIAPPPRSCVFFPRTLPRDRAKGFRCWQGIHSARAFCMISERTVRNHSVSKVPPQFAPFEKWPHWKPGVAVSVSLSQ